MNVMLFMGFVVLVCWGGGLYFIVSCGDSVRRLAFGVFLLLFPFAVV